MFNYLIDNSEMCFYVSMRLLIKVEMLCNNFWGIFFVFFDTIVDFTLN